MKIALFVYDFPHKKSQDFLTRLWLEGHDVTCVIGTPFRPVTRPPEQLRVKPRRGPALHPRTICDRIGVRYIAIDHRDPDLPRQLLSLDVDLGVIAGARILPASVISAAPRGIVNFHPGLLPHARGLDALKWSVFKGVPPGVTVHFIDRDIDAGRIIERLQVPVYLDDAWVDLSLRIEDTQLDLISPSLAKVREVQDISAYPVPGEGPVNPPMPSDTQEEVARRFDAWRAVLATPDEQR